MAGDRKAATTLVRDAIDKGVTTVEDIHKSLTNLPLQVLGESELLRGPAREVKRLHDQTIAAVYGLIRRVNQQVGGLASELLDGLGKLGRTRLEAGGH